MAGFVVNAEKDATITIVKGGRKIVVVSDGNTKVWKHKNKKKSKKNKNSRNR